MAFAQLCNLLDIHSFFWIPMFLPKSTLNKYTMKSDSLTLWFQAKRLCNLPNIIVLHQKISSGKNRKGKPCSDEPPKFSLHTYTRRRGERGSLFSRTPVHCARVLFPWALSRLGLFCPKGVYLSPTVICVCVQFECKIINSPAPNGSEITKEKDVERKLHHPKND